MYFSRVWHRPAKGLKLLKFKMRENCNYDLLTEVKEYLRLRKELFENDVVIKLTTILTAIIITITTIFVAVVTTAFFVIALTLYLKQYTGEVLASLSGGAIYILLWLVVYLFKTVLIVNPLGKLIHKLIKQ